jgi:predicted metal-dependent phosphoesterase TrpH
MRCDLHVHSRYSGASDLPVLRHLGRECYSEPMAVYEQAMRRGMDLVTLTDHDSIEGALALGDGPNTFLSEEVTVLLPGGRQLHVNVFGLNEVQHEAIAARRRDAESLFAYLAEQRLPAGVNHAFSVLTGPRETADLHLALRHLGLVEALNGSMPEAHNEYARLAGRHAGLAPVGGSDSHSLQGVARAYTTVAGARSREEFLHGLRRGLTVPSGRHGSYARLTSEVVRIFAAGYRDAALDFLTGGAAGLRLLAMGILAPALPLIPFFTAFVLARERRFAARHFRRFEGALGLSLGTPRARPIAAPALRLLGQRS